MLIIKLAPAFGHVYNSNTIKRYKYSNDSKLGGMTLPIDKQIRRS